MPTSVPYFMSSSRPLTEISKPLDEHFRLPFIFWLLIENELQEGFAEISNPELGTEIKK